MDKLFSIDTIMIMIIMLAPGEIYGQVKNWLLGALDSSTGEQGVARMLFRDLIRSLVLLLVIDPLGIGLSNTQGLARLIQAGHPGDLIQSAPVLSNALFVLILYPAACGFALGALKMTGYTEKLRAWIVKGLLPPQQTH